MNKSKLLVWFSRTSQFLLLNSLIACFFLEILSLFTWYWKIVTNYKKGGHFGKHLRYFFKYSKECRQGLKIICKYIYGLFSYLNTFAIFFKNHKKILVSKLLCYLRTYYCVEKLHLYSHLRNISCNQFTSWFHGIFQKEWEREKFYCNFNFFRQINSLETSFFVKTLLSRNFCQIKWE